MTAKHFKVWELVNRETYNERGEKAWELIDDRLIIVIDALVEKFGSARCNDYLSKIPGTMQWRGLRTAKCTEGTEYSQHRLGKACDLTFIGVNPATKKQWTAEEIRQAIKKEEKFWFDCGIRCIENNVTWLHLDCRSNTGLTTILWVSP